MRRKILIWLSVIGLLTAAATPAMAQVGWFGAPPPSFYYQNPDGTYDSYEDFNRELRGIPCGIDCTRRAAERWGLIPRQPYRYYTHHYGY